MGDISYQLVITFQCFVCLWVCLLYLCTTVRARTHVPVYGGLKLISWVFLNNSPFILHSLKKVLSLNLPFTDFPRAFPEHHCSWPRRWSLGLNQVLRVAGQALHRVSPLPCLFQLICAVINIQWNVLWYDFLYWTIPMCLHYNVAN